LAKRIIAHALILVIYRDADFGRPGGPSLPRIS
jgi:hypothetical protein